MKTGGKFFRKAGVLLVAVTMLLSSIAVFGPALADTEKQRPERMETLGDVTQQKPLPYKTLTKEPIKNLQVEGDDFDIPSTQDEWFHYDTDTTDYGWGLTGGTNNIIEGAMKVTPSEWALYPWDEIILEKIRFHYGGFLSAGGVVPGAPHDGYVRVYEGDAQPDWSTVPILEIPFTTTDDTPAWYEITLSSPLEIDPSMSYWFSVTYLCSAGEYVVGIDYPDGVGTPGKSHFLRYNIDGTEYDWSDEAAAGYGNVHIRLGISEGWTPPQEGCDFAVEINSPCGIMSSLPKTLDITYYNFGPAPINEVKLLAAIYKEIPGSESEIKCFDVQGNESEIEANWEVYDNGDGDSWTAMDWDDTGDVSWRNTPGRWRSPTGDDPDVYWGHAADSGPDVLVLEAAQSMDGAAWGKIAFDDYCVGEYYDGPDGIVPVDYGRIALTNDGGATWVDVPLSQFVAYDNDWRTTVIGIGDVPDYAVDSGEVDFVVPMTLTDQMAIEFIWTSDPHCQYEGWYIDNVCFYRTEFPSYEKVWADWHMTDVPGSEMVGIPYSFDLSFTPEEGAIYKVEVCGQVYDPSDCEQDPTNNCDTCWLQIMDLNDMACTGIVGPEVLDFNTTGSYDLTVKNVGTFPQNNVPVKLDVAKKVVESYVSGFEGGESWYALYIPGANGPQTHITDCTAYEGGHSLAITGSGCDTPTYAPYSFSGAIWDRQFDLSDVRHAYVNFAARYALSGQIGSVSGYQGYYDPVPPVDPLGDVYFYDMWGMMLHDPTGTGSYFFVTPAGGFGTVYAGPLNYNEHWESADAPGAHTGMYSLDLLSAIEEIKAAYPGAFPEPIVEVGFFLCANDDEYIMSSNVKDFSGVYIDNVEVKKIFCDDSNAVEVDSEETGYLEPGQSETITLEWDAQQFCDYCVLGKTALPTDENPDNDICATQTRVTEPTDATWETQDLTGQGESLWRIVNKNEPCFPDEPQYDSYWWCGPEGGNIYAPDLDDTLYSPEVDVVGATGVIVSFDTYYDLGSGDYGAVYYSNDSGTHWYLVDSYTGFSDWTTKTYSFPGYSGDTIMFKFRMKSDGYDERNGWYIDDLQVETFTGGGTFWTEDFSSGGAGWIVDPDHLSNWLLSYTNSAGGVSPEYEFYWYPSLVDFTWFQSPAIDTTGMDIISGSFKSYINHYSGSFVVGLQASGDGATWYTVYSELVTTDQPAHTVTFDLPSAATNSSTTYLRFFFDGDSFNINWWDFDDVELSYVPPGVVVFYDDMESGEDGWGKHVTEGGDWWIETISYSLPWTPSAPDCDDDGQAVWCGDPEEQGYPIDVPINNEYFTEIDLTTTPEGEPYNGLDLEYVTWYDLGGFYYYEMWSDTYDTYIFARGLVEISTNGGITWDILKEYTFSSSGWVHETINLDKYVPNVVLLRFRFVTQGADWIPSYVGGEADFCKGTGWFIDCIQVHDKHEIFFDDTPPITTACFDEDQMLVLLSAYDPADDLVSGVCATYYKLNGGAQTEYTAAIPVSNGDTIEYWSVDCAGNEEAHKTITISVDVTPPTITITQPEDGYLYLFGNKLMKRIMGTDTLFIGKAVVAADASDDMGVDRVEFTFTIGGDELTFADHASPFEVTLKQKVFGPVDVTATAYDAKGNSASDSTSFTMYCLGLF